MCEPTTILLASTAVSALGAIKQGQQAQAMGNYQAEQANADAEAAKGQAMVEAAQIRKAGQRQRSSAVAAQTASGVSIDSGTAELVNREIVQGAEQDALTAILSGNTRGRQLNAQGQAAKISGDNAATAGYFNAAGSALRAGSALGGWRSVKTTPALAGMHIGGLD